MIIASMAMTMTAERNIAFRAAKMSVALLEAQSSFLSCYVVNEETPSDHDSLEELGRNVATLTCIF